MIAVFIKELRIYLTTSTGYVFISTYVLISAIMFSMQNLLSGNKDYAFTLSASVFTLLLVIPLLTMRLFTEEKRQQTEILLQTEPVTIPSIVLGKYAAAVVIFLLALSCTMSFPLILSRYGALDIPVIISTYAGYLLVGLTFIALGLLVSERTSTMSTAAVLTFTLLFISWIIEFIRPFIPTSPLFRVPAHSYDCSNGRHPVMEVCTPPRPVAHHVQHPCNHMYHHDSSAT